MSIRKLLPVVVAAVFLIALAGVASADVKVTAVLNSWDDALGRFENGNLTLRANALPQPFWVEIGFDADPHAYPGCAGTPAAGDAFIGLYHTDNNPAGAPGFVSTQNWALVKCSTFSSGLPYPAPADIIAACVPEDTVNNNACEVIVQDVTVGCGTGNCLNEIETNFDLIMDLDCDGVIDPQFTPAGGLCMYWEGIKPPPTIPGWSGNVQVRVNSLGDGDKTINFKVEGPNAVGLRGFAAAAQRVPASGIAVLVGLMVLGLAGFVYAGRSARG